jgi:uncharacterized membrane protein
MIKNITEYLAKLKTEMRGCDPALIQDALSDAEEHLQNALEEELKDYPRISKEDALKSSVERYGTPEEVASAYREIESRMRPALAPAKPARTKKRSFWAQFFGAAGESRTWGAFLYILISGLTAAVYGTWALLGGVFSLFSLVLIIGIPVTGLFLFSLREIALVEGRIIEALIGIRMPRKPVFLRRGLNWRQKYKALITESHTWKIFAYLILHFPLGLTYFFITFMLLSLSIKFALYPVWFWVLERPLITLNQPFYPNVWFIPLIALCGIAFFFSTLHLIRFMGRLHGRFAKSMLVRKQEQTHQGGPS